MPKQKNKKLPSLDTYKKMMDQFPICCVDVIFLNQKKNKILLFKRNNEPVRNVFFTTGGALRKGEVFERAAVRNVKQETGLAIKPVRLKFGGIINDLHHNSRFPGITYHAAVILYHCVITGTEEKRIKLDQQHSQHQWFSINDTKLHPFVKERIKRIKIGQN